VTKLFNIVQPDRAYFGQKDAQQLAVIQQMVRDLNMDVTVIGCPIIREADGLAKSSRNSYLSADERKAALVLSQALEVAKQLLANGEQNAAKIRNAISETIQAEPLAKVDYVELVDARTLQQVDSVERPVLVALAVYIGKTRLIDNFITE
jgi:pantoate--beta-alanine ligase